MSRPAFLALSTLACDEGWCWNLGCTTCGRMYFRYALRELVRGLHPDDANWYVHSDKHHTLAAVLGDGSFWRGTPVEHQQLARIVVQTPIVALAAHSRFPDWLGHLGLVLWHCEPSARASRILSDHLTTGFAMLLPDRPWAAQGDETLSDQPNRTWRWHNLESIEVALKRGPPRFSRGV